MRYVVYGAGAIGGLIGGRLAQHGHDVVLIARGEHLKALKDRGLTLQSPESDDVVKVRAAGHPAEVDFTGDDIIILAMKTQDSAPALDALAAATADLDLPVICAQNGVENERLALRLFRRVYGMVVMMPGNHFEPGVVQGSSSPVTGMLDLGCYPSGTDEICDLVAADLNTATFSSRIYPDIMRWKYAKLLMNLGNSLQAACDTDADTRDLGKRARDEAHACYEAAGIEHASSDEMRARRGNLLTIKPVGGAVRLGGSSWQSLRRGTGSIEADYLNGEIALLGRLHGVPTPLNVALQQLANELARDHRPPGSVSVNEIEERVAWLRSGE